MFPQRPLVVVYLLREKKKKPPRRRVLYEERKQVHEECAGLYAACGIQKDRFLEYLSLPPEHQRDNKNPGVPATRILKFYTKAARQVSIHVSPTTRINGVTVDTSSGWSLDEWKEFLDPILNTTNNV